MARESCVCGARPTTLPRRSMGLGMRLVEALLEAWAGLERAGAVDVLGERIDELERQIDRDSTNSSMPPSPTTLSARPYATTHRYPHETTRDPSSAASPAPSATS